MINVVEVCKDYESETTRGKRRVLDRVSFAVEPGEKLALLGRNGAGKSTLLRLITGIEIPSSGRIERLMSVSWPVGLDGALGGTMTGNDNIRFIARLYGKPFKEVRDYVEDFAQLGSALSEPVLAYSTGMRGRLNFALSFAVDFDCYLIDETLAVGDRRFIDRCHEELFERRPDRSLILSTHIMQYVRDYCSRALILHRGIAKPFDDIDLAIEIYQDL